MILITSKLNIYLLLHKKYSNQNINLIKNTHNLYLTVKRSQNHSISPLCFDVNVVTKCIIDEFDTVTIILAILEIALDTLSSSKTHPNITLVDLLHGLPEFFFLFIYLFID